MNLLANPDLFLLLDVGHCLITGEDAASIIEQAGDRLGYVHFDDNDGVSDLHWPLLTGRLTEKSMRRILAALSAANYHGALALELNPQNADPIGALRDGKAIVERLLGGA
jgi:sugar phosphate isomerase/epimerase